MSKPYFHAQSSAKKYGGIWEDYMEIHELMDSSKASFPDNRHRALTHNSWFIGTVLPKIFGETFRRKSDDKIVNTRDIGEQHVLEDYKMRFIPTPADFLAEMDFLPWMQNAMGEPPHSHKKIHQMVKEKKVEQTILKLPLPDPLAEEKTEPVEVNTWSVIGMENGAILPDRVIFDGNLPLRGGRIFPREGDVNID